MADGEAKVNLHDLLRRRLGSRASRLSVLVTDTSVVVEGVLDSYHGKQLVQETVRQCYPELLLSNNVEVRRSN